MPGVDNNYHIHLKQTKEVVGNSQRSSEGDVSPLTSRKVSLAEDSLHKKQPNNDTSDSQSYILQEKDSIEGNSEPNSQHGQYHHHNSASSSKPLNKVPFSYKGFHHAGKETIPPLTHPLKNKHKKSLFGKFIDSINEKKRERPSEASVQSSGFDEHLSNRSSISSIHSQNLKPLSKLSSHSHSRGQDTSFNDISSNRYVEEAPQPTPEHLFSAIPMFHNASVSSSVKTNLNDSTFHGLHGENSVLTLNLDALNDMSGIVQESNLKPSRHVPKDTWLAPESWDVKAEKIEDVPENDNDEYVIRNNYTTFTQLDDSQKLKKKAYHIKIFGEDDDFTSTLKRPYDETVDELIKYLKGRYSLTGGYKLSLRVGKVTKKLEGNQKPIKIQTNLLLLSGYLESDCLDDIGRNDLSYLFKFILNRDILKQISAAEEEHIIKDLVHLNLKSKDLQKIPAFCYSSKVQSLDVSNNGDITLPLDFFQTPEIQLSSLRMVNIRAKTFPPNIVYAKELVSLDLERNFISIIPDSISKLNNLSILTLSCNKLRELPVLPPHLKILDLSSNEFEVYPETVNRLKSLLQLDLSYNKLHELPPSINNLTSVKKMNISANYLTNIDIDLKDLRTLNLRDNEILKINVNNSNIENLYLSSNNISNIDSPLKSLKTLDLQVNPITQLNLLSSNLASLTLSKAKLTSLSNVILSFTKLEKLDLSGNALRELPDISNLSNLRELAVYSNNLEVLPDFSSLKKLKVLDLHDNNLKSIGDVSFIESLNISSNLITELPLQKYDKILQLRAADNQLTDDCFYYIKNFTNLKILSLSYNKIFEIPNGTLSKCTNLEQLFLSGNALTSLPDDFDKIEPLRLLFLNGNKFRTLPSDLSNFKNLELIDVGSNDLKYNTSNSKYEWNWKDNHNLRYLNLSGNKKLEITEDLNLPKLKSLGLMDLTITTQSIPDETSSTRVRTTPTDLGLDISYGYSDRIYKHIVVRDSVHENVCGGTLIGLFDGIYSGKISHIIRETFHKSFETNFKKSNDIVYALRQTFLGLNSVIYQSQLNSEDGLTGSTATVVFIKDKKVYTANIGDTTCMLAKPDGSYTYLTVNHNASSGVEFDRIRTSGGFVSNNDKVDGVCQVSRAAGFLDLLPHIHTGPDISEVTLHDEILVLGTKELFDYIPTNTIGDIVRATDSPMITAEKLRDYAISYGCQSRISAIVISTKKTKKKLGPVVRQTIEDSNLRRLNPEIQPPTGELAMVFTDIKNSTSLWENYPLAMRSAIRTHNEIMRRQLHIVGGYEVKTEGDAFMVSFPTVTAGLIWCFNVQQQLLQEDWPAEIVQSEEGQELKDAEGTTIHKGLSVRMGIHWGTPVCEPDIITRRMDYFGPMVNKTARVCAVADGGEIALTLDSLIEFKRIERAYHDHHSNNVSVEDAFGDGETSEVLDNEFTTILNIGWKIELLGKVQLKGLETEEEISIIYPKQLQTRFQYQRQPDLTTNDVFSLRGIAVRIESILSKISGLNIAIPALKKGDSLDKEFFELYISRIENSISMLALRDNTVGLFDKDTNIFDLVNCLAKIYDEQKALQ